VSLSILVALIEVIDEGGWSSWWWLVVLAKPYAIESILFAQLAMPRYDT
jgi:hypothetical protein